MSNQITWEQVQAAETKRFFYEVTNEDGDKEKRMGTIRKAVVVLSFPCRNGTTEKVAFMASNRSKTFRDSRDLKRRLTLDELQGELVRWIGNNGAMDVLDALVV